MTFHQHTQTLSNEELQALIDEKAIEFVQMQHKSSAEDIDRVKDEYQTALAEKIERKRRGRMFIAMQMNTAQDIGEMPIDRRLTDEEIEFLKD